MLVYQTYNMVIKVKMPRTNKSIINKPGNVPDNDGLVFIYVIY